MVAMAELSREPRPQADQRLHRPMRDIEDRDLRGLLDRLLEDSPDPARRQLRLRLEAEDRLGSRVALLQGYLAMLNDGTLSDPEPVLPILLGHAHELVLAIEDLMRHHEQGGP